MITASFFIDHNAEWYSMSGGTAAMDVSLPIVGTSIGFGAGSFF
jgi:transcriptional regulator GlxA family with amidase domain